MTNDNREDLAAESPPAEGSEHTQLHKDVREAIACLPIHFRTETQISGIMATDLHTLHTVLGATIEEQVVRTLNLVRNTWDPHEKYALYSFVRQAQTFPDVLLRRMSDGDVLLGIELKGWYLLAKEKEPSLRFQVTEKACAEQDLIVVVPWVLSNVISGSPVVFEPFIHSAKAAAAHRNHHWQNVRSTQLNSRIEIPQGITPYPSKSDRILDKPVADRGDNFGRLARTGLMDSYIKKLDDAPLCGIKTVFWRDFLRTFQQSSTDDQVRNALERLRRRIEGAGNVLSSKTQAALTIIGEVERLLEIVEP